MDYNVKNFMRTEHNRQPPKVCFNSIPSLPPGTVQLLNPLATDATFVTSSDTQRPYGVMIAVFSAPKQCTATGCDGGRCWPCFLKGRFQDEQVGRQNGSWKFGSSTDLFAGMNLLKWKFTDLHPRECQRDQIIWASTVWTNHIICIRMCVL